MPMPVKVEAGAGKLTIDGNFSVAASGYSDARLEAALDRFAALLGRQTAIPMLTPRPPDATAATLRVECITGGPDYPALGEDESYTLDVTPEYARLQAVNISGALRGMATFAQLVIPGPDGFQAAAVHIEDRPRFPWRGLMMDVSRHWMPVEVVKRNLEAMAAVKLNVFHWHLSDDQGFRVESKRYPRAAGSRVGRASTTRRTRFAAIVAYARDRGIRVIPEFDIPAHTQSWFPGYPDLSAEPGVYQIGRTWGVYEPVMDPTIESTYDFLDNFIGEMVTLFPDPYFHIGGDEVNPAVWTRSTRIQAFIQQHNLSDVHGLQAYFNQRILKILEKYNRTMVGWDEILHPNLPKAAVIHSWRGQQGLADAVNAGHRGILSWGYYLDHLDTAAYYYQNEPISAQFGAAGLDGSRRRGVHVGRVRDCGDGGFAHLAAHGRDCRAIVVAQRGDRCGLHVRADDGGEPATGMDRRAASANYVPMLDRMAAGRPAEPLRVLADAVEAQGLGPRARARKYTSLVPLNRLVDAARPESETVLAMEVAARRRTASDVARLREQFTIWAANDARFQALAAGNVLLTEGLPVSKDLSAAGEAGLRALDYIKDGRHAAGRLDDGAEPGDRAHVEGQRGSDSRGRTAGQDPDRRAVARRAMIACIGGVALDRRGTLPCPLVAGASNHGELREDFGGVARNVAQNLARLGCRVGLVSRVGDDECGRRMAMPCRRLRDRYLAGDGIRHAHRVVHGDSRYGRRTGVGLDDFDYLRGDHTGRAGAGPAPASGVRTVVPGYQSAGPDDRLAARRRPEAFRWRWMRSLPRRAARLVPLMAADRLSFLQCRRRPRSNRSALRGCGFRMARTGSRSTDGALARSELPALPARVRDVTGAGDALISGTLYGLSQGMDLVVRVRGWGWLQLRSRWSRSLRRHAGVDGGGITGAGKRMTCSSEEVREALAAGRPVVALESYHRYARYAVSGERGDGAVAGAGDPAPAALCRRRSR